MQDIKDILITKGREECLAFLSKDIYDKPRQIRAITQLLFINKLEALLNED